MKIEDIEGIGPVLGEKLRTAGVHDTDQLLESCCTPGGRKAIAEKSGVSAAQLLKWTNMADLCRIKGVGSEYADLLERAGVDMVKELRTRNAANLATKLAEVNDEKKLTRRTPSESEVEGWVKQAGELPPKIEH